MCSGIKIPPGDIRTLEGKIVGHDTRSSARTGSRRQAGRQKSKEGIVTKRKTAQSGRPKAKLAKDMPVIFQRKLETARQFCAITIGHEEIRAMIDDLDHQKFDVVGRFLAWDGVNERLGVIFGRKYVNDRASLAVHILRAHKVHLNSVERQRWRAERELAKRRVHGQKPHFVKKQGRRAA